MTQECSPQNFQYTKDSEFETLLGNFLYTLGYSAENANSITDWCSQGGGSQIVSIVRPQAGGLF